MKLLPINEDKLTPFDLQVLNLTELAPGEWSLEPMSMHHPVLGEFSYGRGAWFLQAKSHRGTPEYRVLSWRGAILLGRRHDEMLSSAVDTKAIEERKKTPLKSAQASNGFNHHLDALRYAKQQGLQAMQDKFTATQMAQAQQDQMNLYRQELLQQRGSPSVIAKLTQL